MSNGDKKTGAEPFIASMENHNTDFSDVREYLRRVSKSFHIAVGSTTNIVGQGPTIMVIPDTLKEIADNLLVLSDWLARLEQWFKDGQTGPKPLAPTIEKKKEENDSEEN
jgi:hypothetical protein